MQEGMLISELAQRAGITPDTVRFYEKKGLLDGRHMTRRDNNYKEYSPDALERLRLISNSKCAGFTLTEIVQMFQDWNALSEKERKQIFLEKTRQIEQRMAELEEMKAYLSAIMPECVLKSGCAGGG